MIKILVFLEDFSDEQQLVKMFDVELQDFETFVCLGLCKYANMLLIGLHLTEGRV